MIFIYFYGCLVHWTSYGAATWFTSIHEVCTTYVILNSVCHIQINTIVVIVVVIGVVWPSRIYQVTFITRESATRRFPYLLYVFLIVILGIYTFSMRKRQQHQVHLHILTITCNHYKLTTIRNSELLLLSGIYFIVVYIIADK